MLFSYADFLSVRVFRDRRRTSFEGAKGGAKDSEPATQRRDRKLLINERYPVEGRLLSLKVD